MNWRELLTRYAVDLAFLVLFMAIVAVWYVQWQR